MYCSVLQLHGKQLSSSSTTKHFYVYISGGPEVRDRFSGAVEAFARRNVSGHGLHGDHSRHRSKDDGPSSKDVVSTCIYQIFL